MKNLSRIMEPICMALSAITLIVNIFHPADSLITFAVLFVCYSVYWKVGNQ